MRCPWLLAQTKVATIFGILVRASLCRRCLQQGYAVTSKFTGIFSFFLSLSLSQLITQHVVVVVNLPSQAATFTLTKSNLGWGE